MRSPWRRNLVIIALVIAVLLFMPFWREWRSRGAIRNLSPEDRRLLFDRSMANFKELCGPQSGARFRDYCEQQAVFLARFPECDPACQQFLAEEAPPTK